MSMRHEGELPIFHIKLEEAQSRIRTLEFDNAELVRWTNDVCVPRLQECLMKW